jgi:lysophospholipase L1-like esterase
MAVRRSVWVGFAIALLVLVVGGYVYWSTGQASFWEPTIHKFEAADRVNPPHPGCIVFTGSSSINFWHTLSSDMAPLDVVNRGFGGSQIAHVNEFAGRIVIPYKPSAVVLYAGENDLSFPWSKSPETVLDDFKDFVDIIHSQLPDTWIYYVSMKPTPLRWKNWPTLQNTNRMIQDYCRTQQRVQYIDVTSVMLGPDGNPRKDIYRPDRLHMNAEGYALWTAIIKPILMSRFGPVPSQSPAPAPRSTKIANTSTAIFFPFVDIGRS